MTAITIDPTMLAVAVAVVGVAVGLLAVWVLTRAQGRQAEADQRLAAIVDLARDLAANQHELGGRVRQLSEAQATAGQSLAERFQAQERAVAKVLEERLGDVRKNVGDNMQDLRERLTIIDAAQKNITELSGQVVELQDILSNKQTRGAFGEVQLSNLVESALPPSAYEFQAKLSNDRRADCLLKLPNPPGSIVIDAKFPLESYRRYVEAGTDDERLRAGRQFSADVLKHVKDIAERYVIPGETAESALMFLPSESVYAELHASFAKVVDESYKHRVWIVSPTTLMATLNTVRAVLKDAQMRKQAHVIQKQVGLMLDDVRRLGERVGKLETHFDRAERSIKDIRTSADGIGRRAERIQELELGEPVESVESEESRRIETQPGFDLGN